MEAENYKKGKGLRPVRTYLIEVAQNHLCYSTSSKST